MLAAKYEWSISDSCFIKNKSCYCSNDSSHFSLPFSGSWFCMNLQTLLNLRLMPFIQRASSSVRGFKTVVIDIQVS